MDREYIRKVRQAHGMTQTELAKQIGLSPQNGARAIRAWENGQREIPQMAVLALQNVFSKLPGR